MSNVEHEPIRTTAARETSRVYVELTKPRITAMVLLTVGLGYALAAGAGFDALAMIHTLIGTGLACSGAGALNQYFERDTDSLMNRTRFRPLPSHRISATAALTLGLVLVLAGIGYLVATVNPVAASLNALTALAYLMIYTPMKRIMPSSTLVGAVPGALPPMIGWSAHSGTLEAPAAVLFGLLFLWQIPHFLAIGRMYREDYARAGLRLLVVLDRDGRITGRQMVLYSAALLPVSLLLVPLGIAGSAYFWSCAFLGTIYIVVSTLAAIDGGVRSARRLLLCSVLYLPALAAALALDRVLT